MWITIASRSICACDGMSRQRGCILVQWYPQLPPKSVYILAKDDKRLGAIKGTGHSRHSARSCYSQLRTYDSRKHTVHSGCARSPIYKSKVISQRNNVLKAINGHLRIECKSLAGNATKMKLLLGNICGQFFTSDL